MYTLTPVATRSDRPSPIPDWTAKVESSGRPDPFSDYLKAHDTGGEDRVSHTESVSAEPEAPPESGIRAAEHPPTHGAQDAPRDEHTVAAATPSDRAPFTAAEDLNEPMTKGGRKAAKRSDRASDDVADDEAEGKSNDADGVADIEAEHGKTPLDLPSHIALTDAPVGGAADGHASQAVDGHPVEDKTSAKRAKMRRVHARDGATRAAKEGFATKEGLRLADASPAGHDAPAARPTAGAVPAEGATTGAADYSTDRATGDELATARPTVAAGQVRAEVAQVAVHEAAAGKPVVRKGALREEKASRIEAKLRRTAASESSSVETRDGVDIVREIQVDLSESSSHGEGSERGATSDGEATEALLRADSTSTTRPAAAKGSVLASATGNFARRLNGELGTRIVRDARIMLQNADSAEIRLIIRPPELGRVRIRLRMDNGHIAGRILVDNGSVREVMEQNIASLQRAFEEAGLDIGDLEVSTGDAGRETRDGENDFTDSRDDRRRTGVDRFEQQIAPAGEYDYGTHRVNLVA